MTRGKEARSPSVYRFCKRITVVKAELGTKRTCPSCATRFYDLLKSPIVCPKCGVSFIAATLLPSKGDSSPAPVAKPREVQPAPVVEEAADVELVSLEDVEEGKVVEEDETAAVADVDLGEEEAADGEEEDTFLEEDEEENADVTGYLDSGPGAGGKEDEEEP
jgi:uncharacterized protein (TIGR02300 family)